MLAFLFLGDLDHGDNSGLGIGKDKPITLTAREERLVFSFDNICETLDLDPGYIREGLLHWRYHRLREPDRVRLGVTRSGYASRN